MSNQYIDDLRDRRSARQFEVSKMLARGKLSKQENEKVADLLNEVQDIDTDIVKAKNSRLDTRGDTGKKRGKRTERDKAFSSYLRSGDIRGVTPVYDIRSDGPGFSTAPNDSIVSAGPIRQL